MFLYYLAYFLLLFSIENTNYLISNRLFLDIVDNVHSISLINGVVLVLVDRLAMFFQTKLFLTINSFKSQSPDK